MSDNHKTSGPAAVSCLIPIYMLVYPDRVNIGFAKQSYQATTGVTEAAFGGRPQAIAPYVVNPQVLVG